MFLGSEGLEIVTDNGAEMGVALVIVLVFAKILATAGAISTGFIGGPIFPLFFVGGAAGTAVNLIFPDIPLALAVGCTMAALTAAALPAPFMITIVVLLVVGIPATEAIPIILAAVGAHALTFGLGILPRPPVKKQQEARIAKIAGETETASQPLNEGE
jgi:H+/Cl- antiporter ClcA